MAWLCFTKENYALLKKLYMLVQWCMTLLVESKVHILTFPRSQAIMNYVRNWNWFGIYYYVFLACLLSEYSLLTLSRYCQISNSLYQITACIFSHQSSSFTEAVSTVWLLLQRMLIDKHVSFYVNTSKTAKHFLSAIHSCRCQCPLTYMMTM